MGLALVLLFSLTNNLFAIILGFFHDEFLALFLVFSHISTSQLPSEILLLEVDYKF